MHTTIDARRRAREYVIRRPQALHLERRSCRCLHRLRRHRSCRAAPGKGLSAVVVPEWDAGPFLSPPLYVHGPARLRRRRSRVRSVPRAGRSPAGRADPPATASWSACSTSSASSSAARASAWRAAHSTSRRRTRRRARRSAKARLQAARLEPDRRDELPHRCGGAADVSRGQDLRRRRSRQGPDEAGGNGQARRDRNRDAIAPTAPCRSWAATASPKNSAAPSRSIATRAHCTIVGGTSEMAKYLIAVADLPPLKPNL